MALAVIKPVARLIKGVIKMKMAGLNHPKTIRLQARLNLAKWEAVGILDTLFNFTAQYCPDGFIGKWKNEEIAVFLDYKSDCDELFKALVESEYLDFDDNGLLHVHDWEDHKPRYVKDREAKANKRAVNKPPVNASPTNSAKSSPLQAKPSQAKPLKRVNDKPELIEEFTKRWNSTKGNEPIHRLTNARRRLFDVRVAQEGWVDDYPLALAKFPLPAFSNGKWTPNIKWFLKPDTVSEIIEGRYNFRTDGKAVAPAPRPEKSERVKRLEDRRTVLNVRIKALIKDGKGTTDEAEELKAILETVEKELG